MGEADKRGKEEMKKEDVEQEEEGCKSKHCDTVWRERGLY